LPSSSFCPMALRFFYFLWFFCFFYFFFFVFFCDLISETTARPHLSSTEVGPCRPCFLMLCYCLTHDPLQPFSMTPMYNAANQMIFWPIGVFLQSQVTDLFCFRADSVLFLFPSHPAPLLYPDTLDILTSPSPPPYPNFAGDPFWNRRILFLFRLKSPLLLRCRSILYLLFPLSLFPRVFSLLLGTLSSSFFILSRKQEARCSFGGGFVVKYLRTSSL